MKCKNYEKNRKEVRINHGTYSLVSLPCNLDKKRNLPSFEKMAGCAFIFCVYAGGKRKMIAFPLLQYVTAILEEILCIQHCYPKCDNIKPLFSLNKRRKKWEVNLF